MYVFLTSNLETKNLKPSSGVSWQNSDTIIYFMTASSAGLRKMYMKRGIIFIDETASNNVGSDNFHKRVIQP